MFKCCHLLIAAMLVASFAAPAGAACKERRNRDPTFIELTVPEGAIRPASAADFDFVTDDVTYEQLVAKVGPPDASQGRGRLNYYIWCLADDLEVIVATRDGVAIEFVRHSGKQVYKRKKK